MIQSIYSFESYKEFINMVNGDMRYSDPHFVYNSDNLYGAIKRNNSAFTSMKEGRINGLFVWFISEEEQYAELLIGLTMEEDSFEEMLSYIEDNYPGYQLDFVINPAHNIIRSVLTKKGAYFDQELQKMVLENETVCDSDAQIELYSSEWKEKYCQMHNCDTYWTAEKVIEASERFRVYLAIVNQELVGYMDVTYCFDENEPYDLFVLPEYRNCNYEVALVSKAVEANKPNKMVVLVESNNTYEINIYENAGFVKIEGQNSVYATYKTGA